MRGLLPLLGEAYYLPFITSLDMNICVEKLGPRFVMMGCIKSDAHVLCEHVCRLFQDIKMRQQ